MKLTTLVLLFSIIFQSYSQISVGPKHKGKPGKFKKGVLDKFKNTETIFVLSDVYERDVYEEILEKTWSVTPYKIVEFEDFNIKKYLSNKYSIANLSGFKRIKQMKYGGTSTSLFTYFDFKIYDSESIHEELKKLASKKVSSKKRIKKEREIIMGNSSNIARFYVFPKDNFIHKSLSADKEELVNSLYTEDVLFNYKPGLLKNYFQKINNLIENEEVYWMYEDDYQPELKKLASNKLYIPSYMKIKYNGWAAQDGEEEDENINDIFKKYEHEYEVVSDKDLSDRIMSGEEFYYVRYVRMNVERFLQIVNSKTGEVIYRGYITGLSYNIKPKHIAEINSKIKKAIKKK
ncbi:hypothetical protein A8C32_10275 [Flavivirga aquatica]|uniref:Uncharacterized protein n=1 Tax=Flavivirga aquatica TaxID=1849968 RepID=A0A1E5TET1_9FLAO|nr:hypothetical protein [Flavivirga aquatica]OEK09886.1 hypothetical protein A8C32_10275 [Flavivirga aquatica]